MELRQLRYFIGVAEAGSLLKASARLHVAQPSLGQQIAALEDELGAQLFERSSRGMSLTESGRLFLEHARVVLGDVERARQVVRAAGAHPSGDVAIGLPTTVALAVTVPILRACREQLPNVRLKVVESYSGFVRELLLTGRLDLALLFGTDPDPVLVKRPLMEERLALVASIDRKRRLPREVDLRKVAAHPLVLPGSEHGLRRIVEEACAPLGLQLNVVAEIDSLPNVKKAVEAGLGSTILTMASVADELAEGRLQAAPIVDPSTWRRVVCATAMTRPTTGAAAAVMRLVTRLVRQMVEDGSWPGTWIGARDDV